MVFNIKLLSRKVKLSAIYLNGNRKISKNTTTISKDYQFIQCSELPMLLFQNSLPRLPIPILEKTCQRFLSAIAPITTSNEYEVAKQSITNFRHGIGMDLHAQLKKIDALNKQTSYISEPWFDMYLSDRSPLPLNSNPLMVMKNESRSEYNLQIVRAANLVISSLRFYRSLQNACLAPEIYHLNPSKSDTKNFRKWMRIAPKSLVTYVAYLFKAYPLDMSQYNRLFGVSRIPELNKDRLMHANNSRHILVLRRGNMYAVDVLNEFGEIEQPEIIYARLQTVVQIDNNQSESPVPIGVLTTGNRNDWANSRCHLLNVSKTNKKNLENEVDAALFCLCLDSEHKQGGLSPLFLKELLAGDGKNRWFDKSFTLLVSGDGTAAVNFEHSWGDGVAVLRYFNEIYKDSIELPNIKQGDRILSHNDEIFVRPIVFDIDQKLQHDVYTAIKKHEDILNKLKINTVQYPFLNKKICKLKNVSPDSIMQLAFQIAYHRAFNSYVGTYESCSTAAFFHGRTETIRPCTSDTKRFCEAIEKSKNLQSNLNELYQIINACSVNHGKLVREAAMGQGFDRHLFALKNLAEKLNQPLHDFYNTLAYKKINHNIISTSTLTSSALLAGAFGPVVQNGLGIGYSIDDEKCGAIVTSYENQCNGKYFVENLEDSFKLIQKVLDGSSKN